MLFVELGCNKLSRIVGASRRAIADYRRNDMRLARATAAVFFALAWFAAALPAPAFAASGSGKDGTIDDNTRDDDDRSGHGGGDSGSGSSNSGSGSGHGDDRAGYDRSGDDDDRNDPESDGEFGSISCPRKQRPQRARLLRPLLIGRRSAAVHLRQYIRNVGRWRPQGVCCASARQDQFGLPLSA